MGSFQAIQHYLADMWLEVDFAKNILYRTAWKLNDNLPCGMDVSMVKASVGEVYLNVSRMGIKIHGAIGVTREHSIGLYYRRAKAAELVFGNGDYHREVVANELGL